jgi:hypothetical protein
MELHSGKDGAATLASGTNTISLPITGWSVDPTTEIVRFRNSKTGNYSVKEGTFLDCTFSITIDHDFDENPFASPVSLAPGLLLTDVNLFLNGGTNGTSFWDFPEAITVGTPQTLEIEGKIVTTINAEASGAWNPPA